MPDEPLPQCEAGSGSCRVAEDVQVHAGGFPGARRWSPAPDSLVAAGERPLIPAPLRLPGRPRRTARGGGFLMPPHGNVEDLAGVLGVARCPRARPSTCRWASPRRGMTAPAQPATSSREPRRPERRGRGGGGRHVHTFVGLVMADPLTYAGRTNGSTVRRPLGTSTRRAARASSR